MGNPKGYDPQTELHVTIGLALRKKFVAQWEVWRCGFSPGGHQGWLGSCHSLCSTPTAVCSDQGGAPGSVFQQVLSDSYPEFKKSRLKKSRENRMHFFIYLQKKMLMSMKDISFAKF